ncbi:Guanylate-binding protein 6 [Monoraphidium neglectum]|uniref:Guanylate-binding protein 6 n=1 Tax=Monoraphidium neglectum TaxID=145388 RepID=A0A0D2MAR5_9CHLO|nr:Guanylate-binding protein 6 [Monoraphidium neglectum]KIY98006.1 Guanylate-binding protein 6 [Monoraphidium neglectum]|eukprot:XP_013897026.1 Guanylate-binding protein 6 [Monoraphidium neglectum]
MNGAGRGSSRQGSKSKMSVPAVDAGPIQLIRFNEITGDMEVCEDAARLLRTIRTPVGVVAVCGRARTGKSFILNQLLGRSAGFRLAHSHRPCTKGLWIWSRPVRLVGPDGQPYHLQLRQHGRGGNAPRLTARAQLVLARFGRERRQHGAAAGTRKGGDPSAPQPGAARQAADAALLLDSEGIDAYNQTAQDGVQLLSLAVLLSSMFVFNQMGPIDEAAIDRLGLVTEVGGARVTPAGDAAGNVAVGTGDAVAMLQRAREWRGWAHSPAGEALGDSQDLGSFTPTFLWLLRDFYFDLHDEGRKVSAREYLEAALSPQEGTSDAIQAKNDIRRSIKGLFPDRDCFTLVRPAADEELLIHLDEADPALLRPQFTEGVARLTSLLFSRAAPKRIGSQIINGPMLAGLATAYVAAINAGAVPTIATAWQGAGAG